MPRRSRHASDPGDDPTIPLGGLTPKALTKQEFGRRLAAVMLEKGMNQSDLARATGNFGKPLGRDSISTYVNGHAFPTPRSLNQLARALGVDREALLPNSLMQAMNDEHPAVEMTQAVGHPDKAWLKVNRMVSFATAAKIIDIINRDNQTFH
jgi:transcriptional regulator with XRE-family HTH domain